MSEPLRPDSDTGLTSIRAERTGDQLPDTQPVLSPDTAPTKRSPFTEAVTSAAEVREWDLAQKAAWDKAEAEYEREQENTFNSATWAVAFISYNHEHGAAAAEDMANRMNHFAKVVKVQNKSGALKVWVPRDPLDEALCYALQNGSVPADWQELLSLCNFWEALWELSYWLERWTPQVDLLTGARDCITELFRRINANFNPNANHLLLQARYLEKAGNALVMALEAPEYADVFERWKTVEDTVDGGKKLKEMLLQRANAEEWHEALTSVNGAQSLQSAWKEGVAFLGYWPVNCDNANQGIQTQETQPPREEEQESESSGTEDSLIPRELDDIKYTVPDSPRVWAKVFRICHSTLIRWFKKNKIRHKKLSSKSYQIAIDDLPANEQAKHRNPSAK